MKLEERNQQASDPQASVWVTANAGSGKTHLLVDRVIRLLLEGNAPQRILCLTFTKAAASEMSRRLFERLSQWIAMDDDALIDAVHRITGKASFDNARARRLFAEALETPGGLKIQTIHAFCERLLQRFPLEAGVVPGFAVLDDQASGELLAQTRSRALADPAIAPVLAEVVAHCGADKFDELLDELLKAKADVAALRPGAELMGRLSDALNLRSGEDETSIRAEWLLGTNRVAWRDLMQGLGQSSTNDQKKAVHAEIIARTDDPAEAFAAATSFFLTGKGELFKDIVTQSFAKKHPARGQFVQAEAERFLKADARLASAITRQASFALLTLARSILERFAEEKRRLGRYGYDDLIERACHLFRAAQGAWVLYKLDGGLDHVLIDEAQDTSPAQWKVILQLTEEFFSGAGAREGITRTIFVVGDEKQSIYSFQGADPAAFAYMKEHFTRAAALREVPLAVSFRSTAPVLQAVDAVWGALDPEAPGHKAFREGQQGLVELWEPVFAPERATRARWQAPADFTIIGHQRLILARRIARMIRRWLDEGEKLVSRGRPVQAGDIIILLRERGSGKNGFMDAMVSALKQQGLPVAGADRLRLSSHIAVLDLMALARFALNPEDDLSLACVLKSPLAGGMGEDELIALAAGRGSRSLWQQLAGHRQQAQLQAWLGMAAQSPYEFFSNVLLRDGAYARLLARLGAEAAEPLDAFLAKCLDYERDHAPALGGFIDWLDEGASEIKRDADQGNGEIRVMTVHAAKGLESNIVILPDTSEMPDGRTADSIYVHEDAQGRLPLWRVGAGKRAPLVEKLFREAEQARQEEYARLLYVAMTRASDRLYIAAAPKTKEEVKPGCWYDHCARSLRPIMQELQDADGRRIWRLENSQTADASDKQADEALRIMAEPAPAWARSAPPAEIGTQWLSPSRIGREAEGEAQLSPVAADAERRFKRGQLIHTLLQYLPELEPARRADAARAYLSRKGLRLEEREAQAIAAEALRLLESPGFAEVFGPGSLAEVPLAALLGDGRALSGRMDRIAVTQDEVLIVDYKTNRPPPTKLEDVPPAYTAQLDAYRSALGPLFPGKRIRTALIWTDGPRFMEVPGGALDPARPRT